MARRKVALQLFTLRQYAKEDFVAALRYATEIGYAGVEFAGFGGFTAKQLQQVLRDLDLQPAGAHIGLRELESRFDELVEYNQAIGNRWLVVPSLPPMLRETAQDWVNMGVRLNSLGARCREQGLQLCYHNHSFEFTRFGDRYGLDILYGSSGADLLQAELDIYWVKRGGEDPADYIQRYAGRLPLLHLKDMEAGPEQFFAEVGEGVLDLDSVFAAAGHAGVEWYIVEQDQSRRDPRQSVRMSINNLKARGIA